MPLNLLNMGAGKCFIFIFDHYNPSVPDSFSPTDEHLHQKNIKNCEFVSIVHPFK